MKERKISGIQEGIVIDHIPPGAVFDVVDILDLHDEQLTLGKNFDSKKMEHKGIIKVGDKKLTNKEINRIALIAPNATISRIKNYKVVSKAKVEIPKAIDYLECKNPNCITRVQGMDTRFNLVSESPVKLKCHYCERIFDI